MSNFYVMWINDEDADPNTFGGGVAFEANNERYAIDEAKSLTEQGYPCYVENEYGDEIWYPPDEEDEDEQSRAQEIAKIRKFTVEGRTKPESQRH